MGENHKQKAVRLLRENQIFILIEYVRIDSEDCIYARMFKPNCHITIYGRLGETKYIDAAYNTTNEQEAIDKLIESLDGSTIRIRESNTNVFTEIKL